jgi:hypothetical protein
MRAYFTWSVFPLLAIIVFLNCDKNTTPKISKNVRIQVTSDNGQNFFLIVDKDIPTEVNGDSILLVLDNPKGGDVFSIGENVPISFHAIGSKTTTQQWVVGKEAYSTKLSSLYNDTTFGSTANPYPAWKCKIKIFLSDNQQISATSGEFTVKLDSRYLLRYPIGGETYKFTDTIPIVFTFRSDSISNIQYFFYSLEEKNWSQLVSHSNFPKRDNFKVSTWKRKFIPAGYQIYPVGDSTKIMIVDYAPGGPRIESGWIQIKR